MPRSVLEISATRNFVACGLLLNRPLCRKCKFPQKPVDFHPYRERLTSSKRCFVTGGAPAFSHSRRRLARTTLVGSVIRGRSPAEPCVVERVSLPLPSCKQEQQSGSFALAALVHPLARPRFILPRGSFLLALLLIGRKIGPSSIAQSQRRQSSSFSSLLPIEPADCLFERNRDQSC